MLLLHLWIYIFDIQVLAPLNLMYNCPSVLVSPFLLSGSILPPSRMSFHSPASRRVLLCLVACGIHSPSQGSRLEAALERLTGERERVEQQRQGGGPAAAADGPLVADMRRMFAATAAAVLMEWRREPDHATILR